MTACLHSATLENLITAEELAEITWAALRQFQIIDFKGKEASKMRLRAQYREDAEESLKLLTKKPSVPQEVLRKIRSILDEKFQQ
ncbi:MAG: hypothetical protein BROFUL_02084 [Candidatus Brocadia fulgida]|uniref:Uncharacterized protein n=1 Tax=Candidatus Brocadia fulgida TaxID=380242 RepID=A0A0M2UW64_9BACT|nr:MAG: hypothetical protein BROFUL_02084 [Candidatus Brocadia fulgida]